MRSAVVCASFGTSGSAFSLQPSSASSHGRHVAYSSSRSTRIGAEGGAADAAQVAARYDKLYAMNDPSKGGSFYLQSKILRAREALDAEIAGGGAKT